MLGFRTIALAGLVAAAFAHSAAAVSIWDEGVSGDLSNDPAAPTVLALGLGTNSITGTTASDTDFFTITVPDGASFARLLLTSFESTDDLAFLAIESGPVITDMGSAANLLGWLHPSATFVGTDILDDVASGEGALGFAAPLGPGTYTLWMQQTGPEPLAYGFDLVVVSVSEPPVAALFALGLVALALARRRRA
jgi:MYXO-CTERM domain-containing protein